MDTVRRISVTAMSAVLAVTIISFLGMKLTASSAGAVSPQWQTTASFSPLVNVNAVSCAPSATASSATCVAVGDDGGQVASIIVTDDGGAVWTDAAPPSGVTSITTVSCPSAAVCYAGGGSGLLKSSNGGTTWSVQDSSFTADSISCVTIDQCTAVGGSNIVETIDGSTWSARTPPASTDSLSTVSCSNLTTCAAIGRVNGNPAIVGPLMETTWTRTRPSRG